MQMKCLLKDVLLFNERRKKNGAAVALDVKKASVKELQAYLAEVLPNFDRDRVYVSDIKKLITWYNLLVASGMTDFEEVAEEVCGKRGCCRIICFGFRHPAFIFLTLYLSLFRMHSPCFPGRRNQILLISLFQMAY